MFRCELRFDEEKVIKDGHSMGSVNYITDLIFQEEGIPKIAEGIYEDSNADTSVHTFNLAFSFFNCPVIVHYCNYLRIIDPKDGDCGDCSHMLKKYQSRVPMYSDE